MLQTPLSQSTALIASAACAWGWVRGRWPERVGAVTVAVDWAGGVLFQDHRWYHHGQPVIFALDATMLAVFLGLVLFSRRNWVLWAAACSLLLVLTHVVMLIDQGLLQWSFMTALYLWNGGVVAALAVGATLEGRRSAPPSSLVTALRPSIPNARARTRS